MLRPRLDVNDSFRFGVGGAHVAPHAPRFDASASRPADRGECRFYLLLIMMLPPRAVADFA